MTLEETALAIEEAGASQEAPVSVPVKIKGIAILGSNPHTKDRAPFADPEWSVYACSPDNSPYGHNAKACALPRVDQWFELHTPIEDASRPFGYLQYVSTLPLVWMRDERAMASGLFPGARRYPEKEFKGTSAVQTLKGNNPDGAPSTRQAEIPNMDGLFCPYMFTSSIAYMLAKSIIDCESQGIKQIGLWGIMQQSDNEYVYQRPGVQYFLHEAMKRGIKVVANRESCLFDMPRWKW